MGGLRSAEGEGVGSAGAPPPEDPARISRTMSSRKLLALDFIKRYFARWGHSPTLGELAAHLEVSNKRAYDLVHQLAEDRMLEVTAGKARGIRLINRGEELSEADVLLRLAAMGWTVAKGNLIVGPASTAIVPGLTEKGLHGITVLDHDPDEQDQSGRSGTNLANLAGPPEEGQGINGEEGQGRAGQGAAAPARRTAR